MIFMSRSDLNECPYCGDGLRERMEILDTSQGRFVILGCKNEHIYSEWLEENPEKKLVWFDDDGWIFVRMTPYFTWDSPFKNYTTHSTLDHLRLKGHWTAAHERSLKKAYAKFRKNRPLPPGAFDRTAYLLGMSELEG